MNQHPRLESVLKEGYIPSDHILHDDAVSNSFKTFVKRWPKLYNFLKRTVGPSHSPFNGYAFKKNIAELFKNDIHHDKVILNLGSGTHRIHSDIINVDIFPFKEVDVVADICNMPFNDASVDGIVCEDVLEHISDISSLLKEVSRVIKPGGTFILKVPFIYPYHSSPGDFFRWTKEGIKYDLQQYDFDIRKIGVHGGPMGALQGILMHVFAIMFSFGSKTVYFLLTQFFMIVFSPLKLLDPLFMLSPFAIDIASDIFIVAEKNKS